MAIATLRELLDEMAATIRTAVNSDDIDVQVEPRIVGSPSTPSIDMHLGSGPATDESTAGFVDAQGGFRITVRARVQTNDSEANQDFLVDLMDDQTDVSLINALYDDPTLNGLASSISMESVTGHTYIPGAGGDVFLGCVWVFTVLRAES